MSGGLCCRLNSPIASSIGRISSIMPPSPLSLLLLFVIVSVTESVPTAEFIVSSSNSDGGEKEMAMSGRSLYWSSADAQLEKRSRDVQPIQLCGYRLLEAVRGLCRGNYVGYNRRSDPDMKDDRGTMMMMRDAADAAEAQGTALYKVLTLNEPGIGKSREKDSDPLALEKSNSLKMTSLSHKPHLRFRRNIIDECCKKPCSVNEMLRYCGRN